MMTRNSLGIVVAGVAGRLRGDAAAAAETRPARRFRDAPSKHAALERYWTLFNDPVLDQLVTEALANNLDLRATLAPASRPRARRCCWRSRTWHRTSTSTSTRDARAFRRSAPRRRLRGFQSSPTTSRSP